MHQQSTGLHRTAVWELEAQPRTGAESLYWVAKSDAGIFPDSTGSEPDPLAIAALVGEVCPMNGKTLRNEVKSHVPAVIQHGNCKKRPKKRPE